MPARGPANRRSSGWHLTVVSTGTVAAPISGMWTRRACAYCSPCSRAPLTLDEVMAAADLDYNAARRHLDVLRWNGLVERGAGWDPLWEVTVAGVLEALAQPPHGVAAAERVAG